MAAPSGGFQPRERRDGDQEQDWDVVAPKRPRLGAGSKMGGRRLIVVLEGASLETVKLNVEYTEKMVSISNYPLSAALTCAKLTTAFEEVWRVI